jgi:tRNA threonylcarbamoyladenosine biosynthesis protein TsaE
LPKKAILVFKLNNNSFALKIITEVIMTDFFYTLEHLPKVVKAVWKAHQHKKIWAFYAPMGAGKTTLIHCLCTEVLLINANASSPTFSIINEYSSSIAGTVLHMDWYRLKNETEAIDAGVEDALLSGNLCFVEWPEKAVELLPDETLHLQIEIIDEKTRRIFIAEPNEDVE